MSLSKFSPKMEEFPNFSQDEFNSKIERLYKKYIDVEPTAENTIDVLNDCIRELGGLLPVSGTNLSREELWFFRVRTKNSFNDESEIFIPSQHSYLPVEKCSKHGRCHVKGNPVFYGSGSVHCAVKEMNEQEQRRYILSIWKLPPQENLHNINFFRGDDLLNDEFLSFKEQTLQTTFKLLEVSGDNDKEMVIRHEAAWSNIFTSNTTHTLSACIAHYLLYMVPNGRESIIMYPSVKTGEDANYAVHPFLADQMILHKIIDIYVDPETDSHAWVGACDGDSLGNWRAVKETDYPTRDPLTPHEKAITEIS